MVTPAPVDLTEILSALQDSINRGQGILEEVNLTAGFPSIHLGMLLLRGTFLT
jgi:hypothetical protein